MKGPEVTFREAFRWSELDRTTLARIRETLAGHSPLPGGVVPRTYPGYPRWRLPRTRGRLWPSLDRALSGRRSIRELSCELPGPRTLGRLLRFAHGVWASHGRGPVPSSGGLQSLELYVVVLGPGWLPAGVYHYDRAGHHLSQIRADADRAAWARRVPSMSDISGGALLWVLVGDGERIAGKYGDRAYRLMPLEAGHLMQNVCLLSASMGLSTVPCGGVLEPEIARELVLGPGDEVLYVGVCGRVAKA